MKKILLILDDSKNMQGDRWNNYIEYARNLIEDGFVGLIMTISNNYVHRLCYDGLAALQPHFGGTNEENALKFIRNYPYLQAVYLANNIIDREVREELKSSCIIINVEKQLIHCEITERIDTQQIDTGPLVETLAKLLPCPALPKFG